MFQLTILSSQPERNDHVIFEGQSKSVVLPGADGEFEILDFHKALISRLKKGLIVVDNQKELPIKGGIAAMSKQHLLIIADK